MKKPLLITICIFLAFASCKKNASEVPVGTISATIDGVDESFNTNTDAEIGTAIELNSNLTISGSSGTGSTADGMAISIGSNNTLVKGTYTNAGTANSGFTSLLYYKGPFDLSDPNAYTSDVN